MCSNPRSQSYLAERSQYYSVDGNDSDLWKKNVVPLKAPA